MSAESDLHRYREEAIHVRSQIAKTTARVSSERKKAADKRAASARTNSDSIRRTRLREADRAEQSAINAERKHSDLEKKLAEIEKKIATAQTRYEKEQRHAQKRALDSIRSQSDKAAEQFRLNDAIGKPEVLRRNSDTKSGIEIPTDPSPDADVFLSHASEDKDDIARPLKDALEARGLTVWFDEIRLKVGQSIRQEIEKGITHARFGVVILSSDFFAKQWTQAELDALFSKKMASGENLLLPIWHRVTRDEVQTHSPLLAGIMALNTSLMTIDQIAQNIVEVAGPSGS